MDSDFEDLDFDSDKVTRFLKHKLEEIQANNVRLERTISERKQHLLKISNKVDDMDESSTGISFTWTKIFNGKYVFGYTIHNDSGKILENPTTFLKWTSNKPLHYEYSIFDVKVNSTWEDTYKCEEKNCKLITKNIKKSKVVYSLAYLIFVVDIPSFTEILRIEFSGMMIYKSDSQEIKMAIPEVSISPGDTTDRQLCDWSITNGGNDTLLAALCSSTKVDLLLVLPEHWSSSIDSTFEIHCALRKIDSIDSCKNYYVAHGLSRLIDDSILEIHRSPNDCTLHHMKLYYRGEDSLICLLHHLHQSITDVTIVPIELYESFLLQNSSLSLASDVMEEFGTSVKKEIKMVETFLRSFGGSQRSSDEDVGRFKASLADLECQTDLIYLKICNLNELSIIPN